jgi:hypothetical protein
MAIAVRHLVSVVMGAPGPVQGVASADVAAKTHSAATDRLVLTAVFVYRGAGNLDRNLELTSSYI